MKKITVLLVVLALFASTGAFSQKAKYAFIQRDSILLNMPEMKAADAELNGFVTELQNEVIKMNTEYEQKIQDYEANQETMSDLVKENKVTEINDLQKRIQDFQVQAQEEILAKREELYTPVFDKFEKAVQDVAKEKGYSAVFPANVALYFNPKDDITDLVKSKLNIN